MKNLKNAFAQFASLLLLTFGLAGKIGAQTLLPCDPNSLTFAAYKPYIDHLNAGKTVLVRAYVVPADLNATFIYDAFSMGEALRRSEVVGLIGLRKVNLTGKNCLKGTGKLVIMASGAITSFNFSWTVQDNYPKILVPAATPSTVATHTLISGDVMFYKGATGQKGVLLTLQKI